MYDEVATNDSEVLLDPIRIHSLKCNGLPPACLLVAHAPLFFISSFFLLFFPFLLIYLLIVPVLLLLFTG